MSSDSNMAATMLQYPPLLVLLEVWRLDRLVPPAGLCIATPKQGIVHHDFTTASMPVLSLGL